MQVKYIVYYKNNNPTPFVDIWKTTGEELHPTYAANHDIKVQNISSCGNLFFNFSKKRWDLEHWQMDFSPFNRKRRKRDKALVQKKIHETKFLADEKLRKQCQKISLLRRIFLFQNN